MNITSRTHFDDLIWCMQNAKTVAWDTETNGLNVWQGHRPISMSFYFPEYDKSFNFAWGHGVGEFDLPDGQDVKFEDVNWQRKQKKQLYKAHFMPDIREAIDFGNCPIEWLDELKAVWARPGLHYVAFNYSFDAHMTEALGFPAIEDAEDVYILVKLVFEDWLHPSIKGNNTLKWQSEYWGVPFAKDAERQLAANAESMTRQISQFIWDNWDNYEINKGYWKLKRKPTVDELMKKIDLDSKEDLWVMPSYLVSEYAEADTRLTWQLRERLMGQIAHYGNEGLYDTICRAQLDLFMRMERCGILLDADKANVMIAELEAEIAERQDIFRHRLAVKLLELNYPDVKLDPAHFNPGSPTQLLRFLHLFGINVDSTEADALETWENENGENEILTSVIKYRQAQKAVGTYLRKWVQSQDADGYIHGGYNPVGTKTGRNSSSSGTLGDTGNYQNIPYRTYRIKECMITPAGWDMISVDYQQLELMLASWVAKCERMTAQFVAGADLHAYTRDMAGVRDILFPNMTDEQAARKAGLIVAVEAEISKAVAKYTRQVAKTLNFGLLYSGSYLMIMRLLKLDEETARNLCESWNALYPEYRIANAFYKEQGLTRRARPDGTGSTFWVQQPISGRVRHLALYPEGEWLFDSKAGKKFWAKTRERQAKDDFNFIIQGLGGYIMQESAAETCRRWGNDIIRPFATIHDGYDFYLRHGYRHILPVMNTIMTDWDIVPRLRVDFEYSSTSWQDMVKIEDMWEFIHNDTLVRHN